MESVFKDDNNLLNGADGRYHHLKYVVNDKLCYFKPHVEQKQKSFSQEISYSLQQTPKFISPKFFYDKPGSALFEQICKLPEYYLTRTEIQILANLKDELANFLVQHNCNHNSYRLVELGSGASIKTRHVLDILQKLQSSVEYVPIDISEFLETSTTGLLQDYSSLNITGIVDTYENGLRFISNYDTYDNLLVFFGSSLGNFPFAESKTFLRKVHDSIKSTDLFLLGLDLVKQKSVLEAAYNDSAGITAEFNLNLLKRMNRELDSDFNIENFEHHCVYNDKEERIEMYLRSVVDQDVRILKGENVVIHFEKDELIHTENSHKYTTLKINQMMKQTGFKILRMWYDEPDKQFVLVLLSKSDNNKDDDDL